MTIRLFVLSPTATVPGSLDRKGHLCPSGSRVHRALAEERVGLVSSPAATPTLFIPSALLSADFM